MRHAIDRWTDTTAFRCALLFAGLVVSPVLALGVLTTVAGGAFLLVEGQAVDLTAATFALVSAGGVLGFLGYVRAHFGAQNPGRHNVTATLVCLAAGIVTALVVVGFSLTGLLDAWRPWRDGPWVAAPALFAVANLVWAVSGVAWMQRLPRRYAEKTGRAFDGLPVLLLLVALALATAALLRTTAL